MGLAVQEPVPGAGVITDLRRQIRDIDEEFMSDVIGPTNCGLNRAKNPPSTFSNGENEATEKGND